MGLRVRRVGGAVSSLPCVAAMHMLFRRFLLITRFNYIKDGVLGGFDIELTQAVCAAVNKTCAIVTVPWQSVCGMEWTAGQTQLAVTG